jgi:hypothetical protein
MFNLAKAKVKKYAPNIQISEDNENLLIAEFEIYFKDLDLTAEFKAANIPENIEEDIQGEWLDQYKEDCERELNEKVREIFNHQTIPDMDLESASVDLSIYGEYPNPGFGTELDNCSGSIEVYLFFNLKVREWSEKIDVLIESLR